MRDEHGVFKQGVFVFRTLDDCERIMRSAETARRAAVIGGGLLGLEAARGLLNWGLETHVIHLMPHLMETQLDPGAADVLRRQFEQMGLVTHLATRTTAVLGNGHVEGLEFADGAPLDCDLVVIAAGIRPNAKLAADAGLKVNRGIVVGDDLGCFVADRRDDAASTRSAGTVCLPWASVPSTVGACTGWSRRCGSRRRGSPIGSAAAIQTLSISGRRVSTKLKVMGVDLAVMGDKEPGRRRRRGRQLQRAVARHLQEVDRAQRSPRRRHHPRRRRRRAVAAADLRIGDAADRKPRGRAVSAVHALTVTQGPDAAAAMPDSARICDCNDVSKAQIVEAVLSGARSVQAVCDATRASTGCGSCRPEVEAIVALACQGIEKATAPEDFGPRCHADW